MPDDAPLTRQWLMLRCLGARHFGLTIRELAQEMGVGEKTIRRDLDLFARLGFPIDGEIGPHGRKTWRLNGSWGQPPLGFTFDEALALYLGRRLLDPLAGTVFWEAAQRAFRKLKAGLSPAALEYLDRFRTAFHQTTFGIGDYADKAELIDDLLVAIEDQKAVHITYQSNQATEPATRDVYPYGLIYHRGALYLVAFAAEHEAIRHYKVNRLDAVEVSPFPFRRPENFDLARHLAQAFGVYTGTEDIIVRVRFAPAVALYVLESRWHASQRLTRQRDGSVLASFRLSTTEEIKRWLLGFGSAAVVLEPERLRAEIVAELRQLLEVYTQSVPVQGKADEARPRR